MLLRRGRFFYWLISELVRKYTKALVLGVTLGIGLAIIFSRLGQQVQLGTVERIGVVGEFSPSNLPLTIQKQISLGLTDIAQDGTATPSLANTWQATDSGRVFTFHLRDDLIWHDGKKVEAKDINYNIRSVSFQEIDTSTIRVTLEAPYSPLPTILAKPLFRPGLKGLGPYKVASIRLKGDTVQYLKLTPVDSRELPSFEYRFYQTEALATLAYKTGDIDIIEDISSAQGLKAWGVPTITETVNRLRVVALFFNLKRDPLLKEKSIRQALGYGLPAIEEERAYSPIAKTSWGYTDRLRKFDPDMVQAKKLLANADIASGSATLTLTTFPQYIDTAQLIARQWSALGITTSVRVESSVPSDYQVLLSAIDIPPDPDQYPFWHSTQTSTNITGYVNLKIDKLLEDGRIEFDPEERKKIYADFARRLVDDAPAIFLYYPKTYTIKRK